MRMENLKAKAFDLRKDAVDIIVAGKRWPYRRRYECDGHFD